MSLIAEGIRAGYANGPDVLNDWSLTVEPGVICGLTGPSGAGKSTAGRVLVGLLAPRAGRVTVDGRPVGSTKGRLDGRVSMLFQSPRRSCNPHLRLAEIIGEPAHYRPRQSAHAVGNRVEQLAHRVGLTSDLLGRLPRQVSDGQLQRAALARVLMAQPDYLVCDESTAMLDAVTTASIVAVVRALAAEGAGVVVISHDHELVDAWASYSVSIASGSRPGHPGSCR